MKWMRVPLLGVLAAAVTGSAFAQPSLDDLTPFVVLDGRVAINFFESQFEDLGLQLDVVSTAETFDSEFELMEADEMHGFQIAEGTDLLVLRNADENFQPYGVLGGKVMVEGGFTISSPSTGKSVDYSEFIIRPLVVRNDGPGGVMKDPDYFFMGPADESTNDDFKLCYVKAMFIDEDGYPTGDPSQDHGSEPKFMVKAWDLIATRTLAEKLDRPDLANKIVGYGKIVGDYTEWEGPWEIPEGQNIFTPWQGQATERHDDGTFAGGALDVKLGILSGINDLGHVGTYPNGRTGMSMSTTSCNVGDVNMNWFAAMNEDHPGINMQLYRELDGRFEMVGISWVKHGFFALSSSQCTPCQNPSNGTFLGVGCSDTYANSNNGDRFWLGPRDEWDAFLGTWECTGSFFDGTPVDCQRDQGGNGFNSVDHRLESFDYDLGNPGATYYYEAHYVMHDDVNNMNDIGSRRCTMSWNGSSWNFATPGSGNALVEGPALLRWGDTQTIASPKPYDGEVVLAVDVTDNGNGTWRYEYALFNWRLESEVRSFQIPFKGFASDFYFHDIDDQASNDWQVSTADNNITFTFPDVFLSGHKVGGPLGHNYLYNFGFTANRGPAAQEYNSVLGFQDTTAAGKYFGVKTMTPSGLNLSFSNLSPQVGQPTTMQIRGGTDGNNVLIALLELNGIPLPSPIIFGNIPFVGGAVDIPFGALPAGSQADWTWIAADVASSIVQKSNFATLSIRD